MKTLYLIRHAKADLKNGEVQDLYRPLNERGYTDAAKMSRGLKDKKVTPQLVITSPAIRTYSTAIVFCNTLDYTASAIMLAPDLHESSVKEYLRVISEIDNKHDCVFIVGHNPTITDCANRLTAPFTEEIPTCGIIGLKSAATDWKQFIKYSNELFLYDYPKNNSLSPR